MYTDTDTDTQILQAELGEARDEIRRVDAKARDLLVVATLAATITGLGTNGLPTSPPSLARAGFLLAVVPWSAAIVELILVIRPMTVPPQPETNTPTMNAWLHQRWQAISQIVENKYTRIRRAVDLLLVTLALTITSALSWYLATLVT